MITRLCKVLAGLALVAGFTLAPLLGAQGTCEINNQANCAVGGDATHAITVSIGLAARLTTTLTTVLLTAPVVADFNTGFGPSTLVPFTVQSNGPWAVTALAATPLWVGSPGSARQDKPAADLQWGLLAGGPFTDFTTTGVAVTSGAATGTGVLNLYVRVRYQWDIDRPGAYTLPLQVVITAP